ncbi:unnamed protein product [Caenorhabditis sp. 36 PRJEB53466]|nr:unnamed protein product [Caenorhabditis sp. 36 PRJEB53466]
MYEESTTSSSAPKMPAATIDQFDIIRHIGSGAYGEVAAVRKIDGKDKNVVYAMKVMDKKRMSRHKDMVDHEWKILTTINNPFFVRMSHSFQTNRKLVFVMPLAGGGDMLSMVEREYLNETEAHFYLCELVEGVSYLHEKHILHRDIKLENLLIGMDGHLLLTDYGLSATHCGGDEAIEGLIGTRHTMAPEVHLGNKYGLASDWWAVGITYCDMRSDKCLFDGEDNKEYADNTAKKRPRFPKNLTPHERGFVNKLIVRDPTKRLGSGQKGTAEVKAHCFFKTVVWTEVLEKKLTPPFIPTAEQIANLLFFPKAANENKFPKFEENEVPILWDDVDYMDPSLI